MYANNPYQLFMLIAVVGALFCWHDLRKFLQKFSKRISQPALISALVMLGLLFLIVTGIVFPFGGRTLSGIAIVLSLALGVRALYGIYEAFTAWKHRKGAKS